MTVALRLAALASTAVPGLDPVSVQLVEPTGRDRFEVAYLQDRSGRRWVIRAPRTTADAAVLEMGVAVLEVIGRRVPFAVPSPRGFANVPKVGRAVVYPYLPGYHVDPAALRPESALARAIGMGIGAIHNVDRWLFDEAGVPEYDADSQRTRLLAQLDLAAATGRVPSSLLSRWESALEDVRLWRYVPTPIHGDLRGERVLVSFTDELDAATATVRGFTGWESAAVGDPATDFAQLVASLPAETLATVVAGYHHTRASRPDPHLMTRARLASELLPIGELLGAINAGADSEVDAISARLRRLDERVHSSTAAAYSLTPPSDSATEPAPTTAPADVAPSVSAPVQAPGSAGAESIAELDPDTADRNTDAGQADLLKPDVPEATAELPMSEVNPQAPHENSSR